MSDWYPGLVLQKWVSMSRVSISTRIKLDRLLLGEIPIYEPGLEDMVKRNVEAGRLHFTTDLTSCLDDVEVVFFGCRDSAG